MTKVLVVYASRHGGTEGIAQRIGEVLRAQGLAAPVIPADVVAAEDIRDADGFVIGSAVYMGHWLKPPVEFLENFPTVLRSRPVWLFSSGPLPGSTASKDPADPITDALGPKEGPGSGGRKAIEELGAAIGARDHRVFLGRYDPDDPPRSFPERVVRMLPIAKGVLPHGDFRNWPDIEAWACEIAAAMASPTVPV
jgi:menaquinone-dependent protoporphyrinogen oxidase